MASINFCDFWVQMNTLTQKKTGSPRCCKRAHTNNSHRSSTNELKESGMNYDGTANSKLDEIWQK